VRIFGLVLAVLRGTEFVLVGLFFLTLNRVLLVDRSEEEVKRFADERLTGCSRSGDTREERERLLLTVEILETDTCGESAEDRQEFR
jgi:hypothetical protein